ncbi:hypothetical protein PPERSA_09168 [Pseudocohnilembus persalinus]|uniref:Sperm-tail PG-rich repeat n=1 Tax=Pseudocohnilembus persalinus TaxID=266149 RepID=A0A0V0QX11_PSEPJ|nr:hypothetical protein PPERSA_09168 [Pseudocohnilembus persalinus]|eukprot:KRX06766.1 hypothetical protein PPERSA_09168 [Pseudocohnilembus persalinus]
MAFVFEQDRKLDKLEGVEINLGPGYYDYQQNSIKSSNSVGFAPFLSTVDRGGQKPVTLKKKVKEPPGPGQYNVNRLFESKESTADNSVISSQKGNNEKTNMGVFKSKGERFSNAESMVPGPGHYTKDVGMCTLIKKSQGQNKSPDIIKKDIIDGFRYINNNRKTNSIPNKIIKIDQNGNIYDLDIFGNDNGAVNIGKLLLNQQFIDILFYYQNLIGGQKKSAENFTRNAKGAQFSKSTVKRFEEKKDRSLSNIGPGKYHKTDNNYNPRYKQKQSSGFASDCVRSYFDQLIYGTTNQIKAQIRQETGYKDIMPGPGQYDLSLAEKNKNLSNKNVVHQFFGSTCERFQSEKYDNYEIGPGQYFQEKSFVKPSLNDLNGKVSFSSTTAKENSFVPKQQDLPGPGQYNLLDKKSIKENVVKKYNQGYKTNFGQTSQRFQNQKFDFNVAPGQYNTDIKKNQAFQQNMDPAFRSNVSRSASMYTKQMDNRNYQVDNGNIANKLDKQKQYLSNLQKIDVIKPGFNVAAPRFVEKINQDTIQKNNNSGLAIIDENQQKQMYKQRSQSIQQHNTPQIAFEQSQTTKQYSAAFKSNQPRLGFNKPQEGVGPGKYRSISQWNKRSYNVKYQPVKV